MTEAEAKTKWCPMQKLPPLNCIGSACMMWREERPSNYSGYDTIDPPKEGFDGHCGLAGKP